MRTLLGFHYKDLSALASAFCRSLIEQLSTYFIIRVYMMPKIGFMCASHAPYTDSIHTYKLNYILHVIYGEYIEHIHGHDQKRGYTCIQVTQCKMAQDRLN